LQKDLASIIFAEKRLVCNQEVAGSIPVVSTKLLSDRHLR